MVNIDLITVEVAYGLPHRQKSIELLVEPGTSADQAAVRTGITNVFPDLDLEESKMGIFGQSLGTKGLKPPKEYELQHGDRVEIYRPLTIDPKAIRRNRAEKNKS